MAAINSVTDLTREGDIAVLTVNSPPVNALSANVRDGLSAGIAQAAADPAVKAIVLICDGRTFIAGADISEFGKPPKGASLARRSGRDRGRRQAGHRRDPRHGARRRLRSGARPATTASPCRPRSSDCPRSSSASFPAPAAPSACRA